ncbi:MAG: DUF6318 family protein [Angustibacter sp.]
MDRGLVLFWIGFLSLAAAVGVGSWFFFGAVYDDDDLIPQGTRPLAVSAPSASAASRVGEPTEADLDRIPSAARVRSEAGAKAFAEFYFDQINKAQMRPDADLLRPFSGQRCDTCRKVIEEAERLTRLGQRYTRPPRVVVLIERIVNLSTPDRPVVMIRSKQVPAVLVDSTGEKVETLTQGKAAEDFEMVWQDGHWLMDGIFFFEETKR